MKTLLIRLLFRLLDVDARTKDLVPYEDLKSIAGEQQADKIDSELRKQKYDRALASAYLVPNLVEWMYLQVVTKRNEHIRTISEEKKSAQRAALLTFLMIIEEMLRASQDIKKRR